MIDAADLDILDVRCSVSLQCSSQVAPDPNGAHSSPPVR